MLRHCKSPAQHARGPENVTRSALMLGTQVLSTQVCDRLKLARGLQGAGELWRTLPDNAGAVWACMPPSCAWLPPLLPPGHESMVVQAAFSGRQAATSWSSSHHPQCEQRSTWSCVHRV